MTASELFATRDFSLWIQADAEGKFADGLPVSENMQDVRCRLRGVIKLVAVTYITQQ